MSCAHNLKHAINAYETWLKELEVHLAVQSPCDAWGDAPDTTFPAKPIDKEQPLKAMEEHVLDHDELMGTYEVK